ncbi:MAG TPA: sodium ion-translocating decarboxylase subunit beta [Candidatus Borkfalkia faecigallinarum]|uniref:Sodium ion-translocating decarboxylase subunit beta n=1 Tax=Candidatus Borkfalkia faecigallinarum TaxID=2838509 RepID=A0A9D1VSM0_9FIRM|nr:sodium ion-translocating decarboxylase subunit beta [Candidatus Borkfalkia faecigallinarum]
MNLWESSGLANGDWQNYVMIVVSLVLMYLAIVKKFEPLLLLPIAFGMFLINIPGAQNIVWGRYETVDLSLVIGANGETEYAGVYLDNLTDSLIYVREGYLNGDVLTYYANFAALQSNTVSTLTLSGDFAQLYTLQGFVQGTVNEVLKDGSVISTFTSDALVISHDYMDVTNRGLLWYLYFGVENVIYPPLIFMGIGAMTDFGPLIANPKSMLIGAGAQLGVFLTLVGAVVLGFDAAAAASIAIIGGADGPTAIYLTKMLSAFTSSDLLATIAIAAYSYMALIPIIQKPIMKLMTTKKERAIKMKQLREVTKLEKIIFPILTTLVVGLLLPDAIPLLGMLMLGNLMRESGVVDRLSTQAQNGLMNTITIFLGVSVGCKAVGTTFLTVDTLSIIALGLFAFCFGTVGGLLTAKVMNKLSGGKINPLIGSAGVSAVPMAARISEDVGREEDPSNHLLMHAMGPNVAGVIGSAIAAGFLLACFGG